MSETEPTILCSWVLSVIRMLGAEGLDIVHLLDQAGIDEDLLDEPGARVQAKDLNGLWEEAVKLSGNPAIGLKMADHITGTTLYVLELAIQSAVSPRDAIELIKRFSHVVSTSVTFVTEERDDEFLLHWSYPDVLCVPCSESQDAFCAVIYKMIENSFSYIDGVYKRVELSRAQPTDSEPYKNNLPCEVSFGHPTLCMVFDLASIDKSLPTGNPVSRGVCEEMLIQYMDRMRKEDIEFRTRHAIIELIKSGQVSRCAAANYLGMSERSLARRLKTKKLSFKSLLEDEREQYATRLLMSGHNITSVALNLGYKDLSSFSRAYKRWTGHNPNEIKRDLSHSHSIQ